MAFKKSAIPFVVFVVFGCGPGPVASAPANRIAFEKKVGADEGKANAFVAGLAALPFAERADYANSHRADVRNMDLIPDPTLQTKFRNLMTNRG